MTGKKDGRIYYLGRIQAADEQYRLVSVPKEIPGSGSTEYVTYLVDKQGKVQDKTGRRYETENDGDVILFANPQKGGLSLYRWKDSREKSDYDFSDMLAEDMDNCSDYMESLTEPDWK